MFKIYQGSSLELLKNELKQCVIHCVITSPPYFKKREYGDDKREIGQENDIIEFCNALADVFDAVNLHPKGSVWVNLGDKRGKNGSLLMVPETFAITMINRGWNLVDNIIWAKIIDEENGETEGGCMIEPASGRLNGNGYENFYRFTKTKKASEAWCDTCAVRIPRHGIESTRYLPETLMSVETSITGRNLHNVWRIKMGQTTEKHYGVFPEALVERPIAMTCPAQVCTTCGFLKEREVEMIEYQENRGNKRTFGKYNSIQTKEDVKTSGRMDSGKEYIPKFPKTIGWTECTCQTETTPGTVLDPFCGTGTVGKVALNFGRNFIGIDLYEKFKNLSQERCENTVKYLNDKNIEPLKLFK